MQTVPMVNSVCSCVLLGGDAAESWSSTSAVRGDGKSSLSVGVSAAYLRAAAAAATARSPASARPAKTLRRLLVARPTA